MEKPASLESKAGRNGRRKRGGPRKIAQIRFISTRIKNPSSGMLPCDYGAFLRLSEAFQNILGILSTASCFLESTIFA